MPYGDCICEVPGCIGRCATRAKSLNETPELSPMSKCTCTRLAGKPHELRCPAIVEAWEKAFVSICKTPAAIPHDVAGLAKECFAAGYVFASDPVAFDVLIRPPEND